MERTDFERSQVRELARLLALLESERRYYQEIVASLPVGLLIVSGDGDPVSANRAFRQLLGLRPEDVKRKHLDEMLPVPGLEEAIQQVLETATPRHDFLGFVPAGDRGVRTLRLSILPIRSWNDDLELEALLVAEAIEAGSNIPVTHEPDAPPASAVEPPVTMWTADAQSLRFQMVRGAARALGLSEEQWLANDQFFEERIVEHREEVMRGIRAAIARGGRYCFEYQARTANGDPVWCRDTFVREGDLLSGITENVTERRLLEDQWIRSQRIDALQQVSGRLAHDLNNPLMIVTGYTEELAGQIAPDHSLRGDVEQILSATQRIARISDQLLQFTRPQSQPASRVNLTQLVASMQEGIHDAAGDASATLSLPSAPLWVLADAKQLESLIESLVSERRPGAQGRTTLRLDASSRTINSESDVARRVLPSGEYATLTIEDDGDGHAGFPSLFENFLGGKQPFGPELARAYQMLRGWGGDLRTNERGTCLEIWLPQPGPEPEPALAPPVAAEPEPEPQPEPDPTTILVVEDEAGIRALVRKILRRHGYRVLEAGSGAEAVEIVKHSETRLDLLLTDVMMPGMSGLELASFVRELRPDLRVLYISGYTDDAQVAAGDFPPGSAFLQKPFTLGSLINKVKEVLEAH
jgi:PAS domain S-box-containing protein